MQHTDATHLSPKALFNPDGDTDVRQRRLIGGNTSTPGPRTGTARP